MLALCTHECQLVLVIDAQGLGSCLCSRTVIASCKISFMGAQCYHLIRCIITFSNAWTGPGLSPRRLINTTVIGVRYLPTASTRCLSLWRGEFTIAPATMANMQDVILKR